MPVTALDSPFLGNLFGSGPIRSVFEARAVIDPTYENVILLGAIVVIRTILSFFLSRELEAIAPQS